MIGRPADPQSRSQCGGAGARACRLDTRVEALAPAKTPAGAETSLDAARKECVRHENQVVL